MELKRKARSLPVLLIIASILCACVMIFVLHSENTAYAQPKIDGWCHVVWRGDGIEDDLFFVTMPDGSSCEGRCMDAGLPASSEGDYPFAGTWNGTGFDIVVDATQGNPAPTQVDVGRGCQRIGNFTWTPVGNIELVKQSELPSISAGNGCYSLSQAEYGIFQDPGCSICVTTLTTDANGYAKSTNLTIGTYYVKETSAPKGYALDTTVYPVNVNMSETTRINGSALYDTPQNADISLLLKKIDAETGTSETLGACSLEGAVFSTKYYDAYYESAEDALASGNPVRSWTFTTSADGTISLSTSALIDGDALFTNTSSNTCLPLGSIVFEETQAPEGYLLNSTAVLVTIKSAGTEETSVSYTAPIVANQPIRGDVEFTKAREDNQQRLGGIPFKITSLTTGESHIIVTDENGFASSAASFNPHTQRTNINDELYGRMHSEEVSEAEREKNMDSGNSANRADGSNNELVNEYGFTVNPNNVSDIEEHNDSSLSGSEEKSTKAASSSEAGISGATASESLESSSSKDAAHSSTAEEIDSEENLSAHSPSPSLGGVSKIGASSKSNSNRTTLDLRSGIWFVGSTNAASATSDMLGALPYDRYSIVELPCAANEGLELITQPCVTISRSSFVVELGTFDNQVTSPEVETPTPTPEATPSPTPTPEATPSPTQMQEQAQQQTVQGKTGINLNTLVVYLAVLSLLGCGLIAYGLYRCKKNKNR